MIERVKYCLGLVLAVSALAARAGDADHSEVFFQRAEKAYQAARARYLDGPTNVEAAWQFGRACCDRADVAKRDKEKAALAREGILACRQGLIDDPKSAWAHYYLGIDLGELASTRGVGALSNLREMQDEWLAAVKLDPSIDYAGPYRCLGLLYTQAPGWPLSVGSKAKAIQYLTNAIGLSPDYPDNSLALVEAYLGWNEYAPAQAVASRLPDILKRARQKLTGPAWESIWIDWDRRWKEIQARLNPSSLTPSPHAAH